MKDKNRIGKLFSSPPEDLEGAIERLGFMDNSSEMKEIREATQMTPTGPEEASKRMKLMGTHPTNLIDFKFNDIEEFCLALKTYHWNVEAKKVLCLQKNSSRQIWNVKALYKDVEIKFILLEYKRPSYVSVFQVQATSSKNNKWNNECEEAG